MSGAKNTKTDDTQMNDGYNTDYTDKDNFLHRDLSYKIIGGCINIHNEYGPHHNERIYHKLLEEWLTREEIKYRTKPKIPIYSKESGKEIGANRLYYKRIIFTNDRKGFLYSTKLSV